MDFSWGLWVAVGLIVLIGGWIWWILRPDVQEEEKKEEGQWIDQGTQQREQMARLQEKMNTPLSHRDRSERARRFSGAPRDDGELDVADVIIPLIIADQMLNSSVVEQTELPPHSHDESPWTHVEYGTDSSSCSSDSNSSGGGYDSGGSSDGGGCGGGD